MIAWGGSEGKKSLRLKDSDQVGERRRVFAKLPANDRLKLRIVGNA